MFGTIVAIDIVLSTAAVPTGLPSELSIAWLTAAVTALTTAAFLWLLGKSATSQPALRAAAGRRAGTPRPASLLRPQPAPPRV